MNKIPRGANMIIVNCQFTIHPKIIPKITIARASKTTPNRVVLISRIEAASDERRVDIAPELFSGRSKNATS